jgi:hypothetical protein
MDKRLYSKRDFIHTSLQVAGGAILSAMGPLEILAAEQKNQPTQSVQQNYRKSVEYKQLEADVNAAFEIYNKPDVAPRRFTNAFCALNKAAAKAYDLAMGSSTPDVKKDYFLITMYTMDWALEAMRQFGRTEVKACDSNPLHLNQVPKGDKIDKYKLMKSCLDLYYKVSKQAEYTSEMRDTVPLNVKNVPNLVVRPNYLVQNGPR